MIQTDYVAILMTINDWSNQQDLPLYWFTTTLSKFPKELNRGTTNKVRRPKAVMKYLVNKAEKDSWHNSSQKQDQNVPIFKIQSLIAGQTREIPFKL